MSGNFQAFLILMLQNYIGKRAGRRTVILPLHGKILDLKKNLI